MVIVGVYKITNKKNNKVYIGQSTDVNKRISRHINELKKGIHPNSRLQADYNTYGEGSFNCEVIHRCRSNELLSYEAKYINEYNATNKTKGYNCQAGVWIDTTDNLRTRQNLFLGSGETKYNEICNECKNECKQSSRVELVACPRYEMRSSV